jgi:hypothetical protein
MKKLNFKHNFILSILKLKAMKDYDDTFKTVITIEELSLKTSIPKKTIPALLKDLELNCEILDYGNNTFLIVNDSDIRKNWSV